MKRVEVVAEHEVLVAARRQPRGMNRTQSVRVPHSHQEEQPIERVLHLCARPSLAAADQAELAALGAQLDATMWHAVAARAHAEGLEGLVFAHASTAGLLSQMPPEVAAGLQEAYSAAWIANRRLRGMLAEVLEAFATRDLRAMVLKGTALAERYYGTIALRPVRDIDFLVRRADLGAAADTLKRLGYTPQRGLGSPTRFFALASAALGYQRADRATVEIHWQLTSRPVYRRALNVRRAWTRALPLNAAGSSALAFRLAPADELRFLCVHLAAEHEMSRLIWLVDIASLVRLLGSDWDWEDFIAETIAGGVATPVAVALHRAVELLDLDVPADVLRRLTEAADTPRDRHAWQVARAEPFSGAWMWSRLAAVERPLDPAVLLRGMFLPRPTTLASLGYRAAPVWRLPMAYLRHWRRAAAATVRAAADARRAASGRGG